MMKLINKIFISCVAVLIAAVGIFVTQSSRNNSIPRSDSETLSIVNSATSIETYRVKRSGPFGSERIANFVVVGKGLNPNPEMAKQLKALLLPYVGARKQEPQKGCPPPEPGVAIRFMQGDKSADILICFQCYDLMVVNDAASEWRDFNFPEAKREALIKIAKSLFPDDADIQKISLAS